MEILIQHNEKFKSNSSYKMHLLLTSEALLQAAVSLQLL